MRRPRAAVVAVLLGAALLAGCGSGPDGGRDGGPPAPAVGPGPAGLVGIWRVTGTDEPDGTLLRLAVGDLSLWRPCGVTFGSWQADKQALVTQTSSATGDCSAGAQPPAWLRDAARYRADGSGWRLLDRSGAQLAALVPGSAITPRADVDPALTKPPSLDGAALAFAAPAPLPAGLRPVTASAVIGRWTPSGQQPSGGPAFLQLAANGVWQASDGCNPTSGRWTMGLDSRVLTTAGPTTMIGCENVDVGGWWSRAGRAGTDGQHLVLVDPAGVVLTTLTRSPTGPLMTHGPVAPR